MDLDNTTQSNIAFHGEGRHIFFKIGQTVSFFFHDCLYTGQNFRTVLKMIGTGVTFSSPCQSLFHRSYGVIRNHGDLEGVTDACHSVVPSSYHCHRGRTDFPIKASPQSGLKTKQNKTKKTH